MRLFVKNRVISRSSLQNAVPSLWFGLVAATQAIFLQVSLSALIFSGSSHDVAAQGTGLLLFGSLVIVLSLALTSSCPTSIAYVQEAPVSFLGVSVALLSAQMPTASAEQFFANVVAITLTSTVFTGICFWLLGRFNLGRLVRFIPYPVVGGFLAGTGCFLVNGGLGIMTDATGLALLQPNILIRWLPGLLFGVMALLLMHRYTHFWLLPSLLVGSIGLFYLIYAVNAGSVASAKAQGWLLGPFPKGVLWHPTTSLIVLKADWNVVIENSVGILAIALISVVALLLNAMGLEINTHRDLDLNRELRSTGLANLVAGLGGSPVGFHSLSMSSLGHRLGVRNRFGGLFAAAFIGLVLMLGADMLSFFPKLILGGFLIFLGFSLLEKWLYRTWFTLPRLDYLLIWLILVVIVTVGLLEGIAIGILVSALLFLINYSKINVIRLATTRVRYPSTTVRPLLYERLLTQRGEQLAIVTLQGYIFFGTAYRLIEQMKARIGDKTRIPLKFLVIDFHLVTGIDSSAIFSFERLKQTTTAAGIQVVLTGLTSTLQGRLISANLKLSSETGEQSWRQFSTLDEGVNWCEGQMLKVFFEVGLATSSQSVIDLMKAQFTPKKTNIDWLTQLKERPSQTPSENFDIFMGYLDRTTFKAGDHLLTPETSIDAIYLLEQGTATYHTSSDSQHPDEFGTLEAGTPLNLSAFYTNQPSRQTMTATSDGVLYVLSRDALHRIETCHPHIAIALHRILAAHISERAMRAEDIARTLNL